MNIFYVASHNNSVGNMTVEPRFIYVPNGGVYRSAKDCILVLKGWYTVGGKILYGWERLYCSRILICL